MSGFAPRNLLVTGGAGFIGQNFVHFLRRERPETRIVVVDALTYAANPTSLKPAIDAGGVLFVHGDITDIGTVRALLSDYKIDSIAHLAAESHVDRSISGPDAFIETNIVGSYTLLKCAHAEWLRRGILDRARYLHVSTDEVYGDLGPDDPPFHEDTPYRPSSPYSASKASSDHLTRAFSRTFNLPVVVTNCSNNYGPYQHPEKLIPLMILHALQGKPLPVYGDGSNVRDWLFVEDHCRALSLVLENGELGGTYNVGGGAERTNKVVVDRVCALIDKQFREEPALAGRFPDCPASSGASCRTLLTYVTDRPGHDRRYAIDCSKLRDSLGYAPAESFDSGLQRAVIWYIRNEPWWRQALSANFEKWIEENYGSRQLMFQP